jgi:hypothetical protein
LFFTFGQEKKLVVSRPRPHPFCLPHGFFFFLYSISFKEFPLSLGHFAPFVIIRLPLLPFGSFRQISLAVRYIAPAVRAILLFWRHIVILAPCCYFGAILLFWRHIVILAPYCYFGAILLLWRHIVIMAPYCYFGAILH